MLENSVWKKGVRGGIVRIGLLVLVAVIAAVPILQGAPPVFADENEVIVTTGEELDAAIKAVQPGAVIKLANDIDAISSATYNLSTNPAFTIDGDGHTIDGKEVAMTAIRIRAAGGVTVRNLTFRNMRSSLRYGGGALGTYRTHLFVENCAFIGNRHEETISTNLNNGGGALLAHSASYQFTLTNSTFYDNYTTAAGGAISARNNPSVINGVTVINNTSAAGNGGGINSSGKVITLKNSIVAGNKIGVDPITDNDLRNPVDGGNNLIGSALEFVKDDSTTIGCVLGELGLSTGAPQAVRNFGGSPYVIKITSPNSPALGNAGVDAPATDQRGQVRDNAPDIGAFEYARVNVQLTDYMQGLIAEGEALDEERFEAAYWTVFADALAAAKTIANNPEAYTDDEALNASSVLLVALQNLYQHMTVDRGYLRAIITEAEKILVKSTQYITVSVQNLTEKVDAAKVIRDKADATQEEIDEAYFAVISAISNMFEKGDKRALQSLVGLSALYVEANYTPASWTTFREALSAAQAILLDPEAIKENVDGAFTVLSNSMKNLVRKADLTALKASINAAQNIVDNIDDYLASTVVGLPTELAAAKLVRDDVNASQAQVNAATTALNGKILAARLKADKSQLLSLVAKAESLNLKLYTAASAGSVKAAMIQASAVLKAGDEKVTQQDVDAASGQLSSAIKALALIPQTQKSGSSAAKTGENTGKASAAAGSTGGSTVSAESTAAPAPTVSSGSTGTAPAQQSAVLPPAAGAAKSAPVYDNQPSAGGQATGEQPAALADLKAPALSESEDAAAAQTGWIIAFILLAAFAASGWIALYRNARRRNDENSF